MELRGTILGLLSWKPSSGYDLKRIISSSDLYYWSGNNNQIYKILNELQKEGLVTYQVQVQKSLPAKKIYTITEKGFFELHEYLLGVPEVAELRKVFLIQLAWADYLTDDDILSLLTKYEFEISIRLGMCQDFFEEPGNCPNRSKREIFLWKRIADNLIGTYQTELDWVRQTQQEFLKDNNN
jgi:PadR family transcriptional regulator, regulatory protein AphA